MNKIYHIFVEGGCEKKLIDILKNLNCNCIVAGKETVHNFINNKISDMLLMNLNPYTNIVLAYDTDAENTTILEDVIH